MNKDLKIKITCIKLGYYNGAWATSVRLATIYDSIRNYKKSGYWLNKAIYYRDKTYKQEKRVEEFIYDQTKNNKT